MKFLANENFPGNAVKALEQHGHDVAWVRALRPGISDVEVLYWANSEQRILLTFDKDFGELVYFRGKSASCGVVLFRISMQDPASSVAKIVASIQARSDWQDHFTVIEDGRIRMSKLH
jgi:predicted nuclease of predicted toxin-antitoxin system